MARHLTQQGIEPSAGCFPAPISYNEDVRVQTLGRHPSSEEPQPVAHRHQSPKQDQSAGQCDDPPASHQHPAQRTQSPGRSSPQGQHASPCHEPHSPSAHVQARCHPPSSESVQHDHRTQSDPCRPQAHRSQTQSDRWSCHHLLRPTAHKPTPVNTASRPLLAPALRARTTPVRPHARTTRPREPQIEQQHPHSTTQNPCFQAETAPTTVVTATP